MKNFFSYAMPAITAVVVAVLTYLIGGEGVEMYKAWLAAAFAGFAGGTAASVGYAVGKDGGWSAMGIGIAVSAVFAVLAAWSMTL